MVEIGSSLATGAVDDYGFEYYGWFFLDDWSAFSGEFCGDSSDGRIIHDRLYFTEPAGWLVGGWRDRQVW